MTFRTSAAAFALFTVLVAQEGPERSKASDYPVHAALPTVEIGAEYLVHSIPGDNGLYFSRDYLVVDVGVFPLTKGGAVSAHARQFTLRLNGKTLLEPESPGAVAASLKYPDWEQRPTATAQAGPVIFGAPPVVGRFPGDPRPDQGRLPPAPRVPERPDPSGQDKQPPKPIEQQIAKIALPEGSFNEHIKGCVFFRFTGKMKSIRSVELLYDAGDNGPKTTLKFF